MSRSMSNRSDKRSRQRKKQKRLLLRKRTRKHLRPGNHPPLRSNRHRLLRLLQQKNQNRTLSFPSAMKKIVILNPMARSMKNQEAEPVTPRRARKTDRKTFNSVGWDTTMTTTTMTKMKRTATTEGLRTGIFPNSRKKRRKRMGTSMMIGAPRERKPWRRRLARRTRRNEKKSSRQKRRSKSVKTWPRLWRTGKRSEPSDKQKRKRKPVNKKKTRERQKKTARKLETMQGDKYNLWNKQ
mmetsp:Transcript_1104/g.2467  ORF Transcript_1104/g.2467 Transcript_1104/m.2467 type:complete len:239 (+) Transcript_1104:1062-1778(+)